MESGSLEIKFKSFHHIPPEYTGKAFIKDCGATAHLKDGMFHRKSGPAIEFAGQRRSRREWWIEGNLHREDGPAIECFTGSVEWFLNGKYYENKELWFEALTPEQKENALWSVDLWK